MRISWRTCAELLTSRALVSNHTNINLDGYALPGESKEAEPLYNIQSIDWHRNFELHFIPYTLMPAGLPHYLINTNWRLTCKQDISYIYYRSSAMHTKESWRQLSNQLLPTVARETGNPNKSFSQSRINHIVSIVVVHLLIEKLRREGKKKKKEKQELNHNTACHHTHTRRKTTKAKHHFYHANRTVKETPDAIWFIQTARGKTPDAVWQNSLFFLDPERAYSVWKQDEIARQLPLGKTKEEAREGKTKWS